jgi:hypothetical protein
MVIVPGVLDRLLSEIPRKSLETRAEAELAGVGRAVPLKKSVGVLPATCTRMEKMDEAAVVVPCPISCADPRCTNANHEPSVQISSS